MEYFTRQPSRSALRFSDWMPDGPVVIFEARKRLNAKLELRVVVLSASYSNAQEPSVPVAASEITVDANSVDAPAAQPQAAHAAAVEYSHGYEIRAKVHKYASIAMLPLFATDVALGQSLHTSSTERSAARTSRSARESVDCSR